VYLDSRAVHDETRSCFAEQFKDVFPELKKTQEAFVAKVIEEDRRRRFENVGIIGQNAST
jgi:hypothetical protein